MDLLQSMGVFIRVTERASFSGAARELGISKAAASKHVRALEERLGVRLLNRTTRRLSLTEEGRLYLEWCRRIQADLAEAEQAVTRQHGEPRGTLRVTAPMSFGIQHLGPALPDFLACYGELAVDLTLNDSYVDLLEEGYDMAIRIGALEDSSLVARRLASTRRVLCAAPAYLQRHGRPRRLQDLVRHNCLIYSYARSSPGVWRFRRSDGKEVAVSVRGSLDANNGDVIRAAALAGAGIAWQPSFIVGDDIRAGRLEHLLPHYGDEIGIHAVYPQTRYLSAKVRAFVDYLAARFGGRPSWEDFA